MDIKYWKVLTIFGWVLFIAALVFAILFGLKILNYNDAKAREINDVLAQKETEMNTEFIEENEKETVSYVSDEIFGLFEFAYPKVWQTNVTQDTKIKEQLTFLTDPSVIVINKDIEGPYTALRVAVYDEKYVVKLKDLETKNKYAISKLKEEDITISEIVGKKFSGKDPDSGKNIIFVVLPLRDKSLYIGTDDASLYTEHYNTILSTFKINN